MKFKFLFDLDGTITQKEVLPIIANELGIGKKMARLTKRTMDGEIPFEYSFTKRVNMLKKIPISRVQKIVEEVPVSENIVKFVRRYRDRCFVVTGNLDVWIELLAKKIGIKYFCSQADYKSNILYGIKHILRKQDVPLLLGGNIVAVGEGHNDVEMLRCANIGIAYGGVHKPASSIMEIASYAIYSDLELCRFLKQLL